MSIIDKARSDRRITPLLNRIQRQIKLQFKKSRQDGWSSTLETDRAVIEYASCPHPSAALAHELLRLDTQLSGYRRIRLGISSAIETDAMPGFINALDNGLQHHKIYSAFLALGFQAEQFYPDSDKATSAYLNHVLSAPHEKLVEVIPAFFTLIAPGGAMPLDTYQSLYDSFLRLNNGVYAKQLLTIEQLMKDWSIAGSLDQTVTVRKIMLTIEPTANFSWFGFTDETGFPDQGFFVDEVFSVRLLPT